MDDAILTALRRAVDAAPDDARLRLRLAELLVERGRTSEAIDQATAVLEQEPGNDVARDFILSALSPSATGPVTSESTIDPSDWELFENEVDGIAQPMFVSPEPGPDQEVFEAELPTITLSDVGGMKAVKDRLEAAFLAPLRNPQLRRLYSKSLSGGLLMYGPPGCGKTFIARAVAGELGVSFVSVGLADILNPYFGQSENNVHEAFRFARQKAPCVLFFDEIDSIGQRRSQTGNSMMRGVVNQLLAEMSGFDDANEGLFVLAATNQPWDLDPAIRRPGRFDRTVLVLPPDLEAREAIFRNCLQRKPIEGIDVHALARRTEGHSGADIAYICEAAAEIGLLDSVRSGEARMIVQHDLETALSQVRPSTSQWLESARNVVTFGEDDGTFSELRAYLKSVKRL